MNNQICQVITRWKFEIAVKVASQINAIPLSLPNRLNRQNTYIDDSARAILVSNPTGIGLAKSP